jgi:hypothetical protein
LGTYFIVQELEIGVLFLNDDDRHFGLAPEFGLMLSSFRGTIFFVNALYNYAIKADQHLKGQGKDRPYRGINVDVFLSYNGWLL